MLRTPATRSTPDPEDESLTLDVKRKSKVPLGNALSPAQHLRQRHCAGQVPSIAEQWSQKRARSTALPEAGVLARLSLLLMSFSSCSDLHRLCFAE